MSTVSETLDLPGGAAPTDVVVTVTLAGAEGEDLPAGYATTADTTVVGRHQLRPDDTGECMDNQRLGAALHPHLC